MSEGAVRHDVGAATDGGAMKHGYPQGIAFVDLATCRICGGSKDRLSLHFADVADPEVADGGVPFRIWRCTNCETGLTDPYPSEETVHLLYSGQDSSDLEFPERGLVGRLKELLAARRAKQIVTHLGRAPKKIADFGTGGGRYAYHAKRAFPAADVVGVDFADTPPPHSYYDQAAGMVYVPYSVFRAADDRYDVILVRHVLEHVHDPVELLRSLLAKLSPGGFLYLEVPNFDSAMARVVGARWPLLYVPRHLSHFSKAGLAATIAAAGGTGSIERCEMPLMGNVVAIELGASRFDPRFKLAGVLAHPIQVLVEAAAGQGTCLVSYCRARSAA